MKTIAAMLIVTLTPALSGQEIVTLLQCHRDAVENAPRTLDRESIQQIGILKEEQVSAKWYPALELNGKISYQSDVVTVALEGAPISIDFPDVPHDQYGVNLDLRQTLYDGGMSKELRLLEQAKTAANLQQVEVDLHSLKRKVNHYYFGMLILQENRKNLEIHMENLVSRREVLRNAIEMGVIPEAELKVIDVEILRIKQSYAELDSRKEAVLEALNLLCETEYNGETHFELPEFSGYPDNHAERPEHLLFELQDASLEAGKRLAGKKRMPLLYAFGQTGYGLPGYNMLGGEWDLYYMIGAGLKWNIWDWNCTRKEQQVVAHRQQMLRNRRASFDKKIATMLVQEESNIERFRKSMELDEQVLNLREEVSEHAASRLSNGTITATDYITELNKENLARINRDTHRIQLMQSMANYLTIQGNL